MTFYTGGSERMRIDTSGNVTNQATTAAIFTAQGLSGFGSFYAKGSGTNSTYYFMGNAGGEKVRLTSEDDGTFTISNTTSVTERMRIDTSGCIYIGTSDNPTPANAVAALNILTGSDGLNIKNVASGNNIINIWSTGTSTNNALYFYKGDTQFGVGSISTSTTSTAYNTTSDYRLKDVIGPIQNSGTFIDSLKPIAYSWKSNGLLTAGFLAHEFATVSPSSVNGDKDAVNSEGVPIYQAMQASSAEVMANIIAELQSLRSRLTALEAK